MNRRDFLKLSGKTVAALGMSDFLLEMFLSQWNHKGPIALAIENHPIFVTIQLSGGNDGISTIIPYADATYYDERPTLAYQASEIIRMDSRIGLHPSLTGFKSMYDEGKLALIEGVGYPNPDRSHFRASEIWQTANPGKMDQTGWLGRYLDLANEQKYPLMGLSIGSTSKIFLAKNNYVPTINDIRRFKFVMDVEEDEEKRRNYYFDKMYRNMKEVNLAVIARKGMAALKASNEVNAVLQYEAPKSLYPGENEFAQQLSFISQCISSTLGTNSYFIETGGYDEHENEKNNHMQVLKTLDQAVYAFYQDLKQKGLLDRVVVLIYSEFGRRIKENASGGTDHGSAGPVFVFGGKVKGGLYGDYPNFNKIDDVGDFQHAVDFRSIYASILEKWMKVPAKDVLLGQSYELLPFL